MLIIFIYIYSLFHRDETKPTHIIGINSFLFLMQLIYKHSSPNYQHMINYWKLINKMLVYIWCVHKLKHFQPHSLLCHLWCIYFAISSFLCDIYIWWFEKLTKQLRQTFFFFIIYNLFHIANQLYQHSSTSRTIASSQHHPRETRPLLSQPNLYKNCYIGFAYYEFVSYITRNASIYLLIHFLLIQLFLFSFLHFHI